MIPLTEPCKFRAGTVKPSSFKVVSNWGPKDRGAIVITMTENFSLGLKNWTESTASCELQQPHSLKQMWTCNKPREQPELQGQPLPHLPPAAAQERAEAQNVCHNMHVLPTWGPTHQMVQKAVKDNPGRSPGPAGAKANPKAGVIWINGPWFFFSRFALPWTQLPCVSQSCQPLGHHCRTSSETGLRPLNQELWGLWRQHQPWQPY